MDCWSKLEEIFESVAASNEKIAWDIIKDLESINEGLQELNRNLEINEVKIPHPNGPVDKMFGICYEDGQPMIGDKLVLL